MREFKLNGLHPLTGQFIILFEPARAAAKRPYLVELRVDLAARKLTDPLYGGASYSCADDSFKQVTEKLVWSVRMAQS